MRNHAFDSNAFSRGKCFEAFMRFVGWKIAKEVGHGGSGFLDTGQNRSLAEEEERQHVVSEVVRIHRPAKIVGDLPKGMAELLIICVVHDVKAEWVSRKDAETPRVFDSLLIVFSSLLCVFASLRETRLLPIRAKSWDVAASVVTNGTVGQYELFVVPELIPWDGSLGLDEAGIFWDEPTTKGCFANEIFVFGGPRRLVAGLGKKK
jgi:hypothetical protein